MFRSLKKKMSSKILHFPSRAKSSDQTGNENQAEEKKVYVYIDLKDSHSIRIIKLLPGKQSTPLLCEIIEDEIERLEFEALSYVWGEQIFPNIIVEVKTTSLIYITDSLSDALQELRYENKERFLWIDQICINQPNTKEKASQVSKMDQIYRNATRTIVWLGKKC